MGGAIIFKFKIMHGEGRGERGEGRGERGEGRGERGEGRGEREREQGGEWLLSLNNRLSGSKCS